MMKLRRLTTLFKNSWTSSVNPCWTVKSLKDLSSRKYTEKKPKGDRTGNGDDKTGQKSTDFWEEYCTLIFMMPTALERHVKPNTNLDKLIR